MEDNLYGRSLSAAAPPHRFPPGAKGGLYSWAHLNARQFRQLCDGPRTVYLTFAADRTARLVSLPEGHDPNSFFVHGGGDAPRFQALLDRARS